MKLFVNLALLTLTSVSLAFNETPNSGAAAGGSGRAGGSGSPLSPGVPNPGARPAPATGLGNGTTVVTPGYAPPLALNPGDFNISNSDVAALISPATREFFLRDRENAKYLMDALNDLQALLAGLQNEVVIKKLQTIAFRSQTVSGYLKFEDYLTLRTEYYTAKSRLEIRVQSLRMLANGNLPSQSRVQVTPNTTVTLPAYISGDLEKMATYYTQQVATIDAAVAALQFTVLDKGNVPRPVAGLNPNTTGWRMATSRELDDMRADIRKAESQLQALMDAQDNLSNGLSKLAHNFLVSFGSSERWRGDTPNMSARIADGMKDAYDQVAQVLWARSYLRVMYKMPVGVIPVTYKKAILNLDIFLQNPLDFVSLFETNGNAQQPPLPIRAESEIIDQLRNYDLNVKLADMRAVSIYDGNASAGARIISLIGQVRGYTELAQAVKLLLPALKMDMEEDRALMRGQVDLIEDIYAQRYYANAEAAKQTQLLECRYEERDQVRAQLGCTDATRVLVRAAGTEMTKFRAVVDESIKQFARLEVVRDLRQRYNQLANFGSANDIAGAQTSATASGLARRRQAITGGTPGDTGSAPAANAPR